MVHQYVQPFLDAWQASTTRLSALKGQGRRFIGYFCTYTPIEVVHAAGFIPIRIMGGFGAVEKAYNYTPDFICPYMRRCLERALKGRFHYLAGIVQGYSCDAACGCVNIWASNIGGELFHTVALPYNDSPEARQFYQAALLDLIQNLERIGGQFSISRLEHSLGLYRHIRNKLLILDNLRAKQTSPFKAVDLMAVVYAGFVTEPDVYLGMLENLTTVLRSERRVKDTGGVPFLVSGSVIESLDFLGLVESCGGRLVADDLCTGIRSYQPVGGKTDDPFAALVDRHMQRAPCPSRARPRDRMAWLTAQIGRSGARGVVFILQKHCTPHQADYPILSRSLKNAGVPNIMIEVDETWRLNGQVQTRLQGFFEMLRVIA